MKKTFLLVFCGLWIIRALSQDSVAEQETSSEAFNLISAGYAGAGAAPKVNLKTYNFTAQIGKQDFDFYLFNSVPTIVPKLKPQIASIDDDKEVVNPAKRYLANDILQQMGGLLNLSIGKVAFFAYGQNPELKYSRGFQTDFRIGGKMLEAPFENKSEFFPALHSFLDLRYLIPLFDPKLEAGGLAREETMVGNLSFRVVLGVQKFFTGDDDPYTRFFTNYIPNPNIVGGTLAVLPQSVLLSGNFETFFYLSNKIYISAGYYYSNDPQIDSYPYFSISYGIK